VSADTGADPFDRVYRHWAETAVKQHLDPPSRERWDKIVLRLILSEDPARVRRYRLLEDSGPEGLGADAYELWQKTPPYTENLSIKFAGWPDFDAYEQAQRGSMKRLMEGQGLGERYRLMVEAREQHRRTPEYDPARVKRAQTSVVIIGCVGIALIGVMMLAVLVIIAVRLGG
jgi:hypothetical protein